MSITKLTLFDFKRKRRVAASCFEPAKGEADLSPGKSLTAALVPSALRPSNILHPTRQQNSLVQKALYWAFRLNFGNWVFWCQMIRQQIAVVGKGAAPTCFSPEWLLAGSSPAGPQRWSRNSADPGCSCRAQVVAGSQGAAEPGGPDLPAGTFSLS